MAGAEYQRLGDPDAALDPRVMALAHAGMAEHLARLVGQEDAASPLRLVGEVASAVACGLVYVGDQIKAAAHPPALPNEEVVDRGWREFVAHVSGLREQVARIPAGVEQAARVLTSRLSVAPGTRDWRLDGLPLADDMVMPLVSLSDWLNHLDTVRATGLVDGRAGD